MKKRRILYAQLTLAVHDLNLLLERRVLSRKRASRSRSPGALRTRRLPWSAPPWSYSLAPGRLRADQVEMQNGDRYAGQVLSLNTNTVVLQSDVLGTLRLPRAKVAVITLGAGPATNSPALPSLTNAQVRAPSPAPDECDAQSVPRTPPTRREHQPHPAGAEAVPQRRRPRSEQQVQRICSAV